MIENADDRLEIVRHAHQSGMRDRSLKCYHPDRKNDFQMTSNFRNTDEDIVLAMIFDFLALHIFSTDSLYGGIEPSLEKQIQILRDTEEKMAINPKTSKGECPGL